MVFSKKIIFIGFILLAIVSSAFAQELQITKLERQIVLNGPYPLEQSFVQFKSSGNVNTFRHVVPFQIVKRTSKVVFSKTKQGKQPLPYTREQYLFDGQKYIVFKVQLDRSYFSDEQGQLYILTAFLNRYVNFPKQITMIEDQKFEFADFKYFVSPYKVLSQTNTYKFDKLINHDKDGEVKGANTVVFKKKNAEPFTTQQHVVHGVNNDPQVYFTDVQKIIQVSHWGNIAITQFYSLKNFGPSLKGQFSRIGFGSQEHGDVKNAFRGIQAQLPYDTWGLYYRDQVGNISTSKAYRDEYQKKVRLALVPRFSLLGQWKCNWEVGYNLPTKNFLYNQADKFQLDNIELQYTLDKIISENYDLKIILPEGSRNVKVKIGGQQIAPTRIQKSYGYLDFFGRPNYIFQNYRETLKKKQIIVDYELDTISTFYKPIVLFVAILSLLAVLIISKRLKLEAFKEEKAE